MAESRARRSRPVVRLPASRTAMNSCGPYQQRVIAACEYWLTWSARHHVDPLASDVDALREAALDLRRDRASDTEVLDLVDQVGAMTGAWGTLEWVHLRRSV